MIYLILFNYIITPQKHACFLTRDRKRLDPDGREAVRELEGIEREETLIRIYRSIFKKREKVQ